MKLNDIEVKEPQILSEMNNKTQTQQPTETVAELEAKLAAARTKEREEKEKEKQAYESLKADTVQELCTTARTLSNALETFKKEAFEKTGALYGLLQQYSSRHADGKGNFKVEHDYFRVNYKRQGKATFDERSHQAEKHIIDFVNTKFNGDKDTMDFIMTMLERKKGELDINLVQKLYAMEDRFDDENWKRGIQLLKESYKYSHSKDYITFEIKDETGKWELVNLQFSSV